jgi:LuxR family maltose regulon positive regulatory protein
LAEPSLADAADLFPAGVTLIELTRGEGRVLDLLARGLTLQQVADTLVVSYNTVKTQQRSLYRKLGTNSRPDAIARARHLGLI